MHDNTQYIDMENCREEGVSLLFPFTLVIKRDSDSDWNGAKFM